MKGATAMSVEEKNKDIVRRHYEDGFNRGDAEVATENFAPEYVNHLPGEAEPQRGPEAWKETYRGFRRAFPDITTTMHQVFAEGDRVAVRHEWTGTHEGEFEGIPPTGRQIRFTGNDIYRLEDGKIVEEWSEFDLLGLLGQLGAVPRMLQPE